MANSPKNKKKTSPGSLKRRERRFSTSSTFMPAWVALVGFLGCAALGAGVYANWFLDPAPGWATYVLALGGFGFGVSLWFGQPNESAVAVGDSGIAVEDGKEVLRVQWYRMRALRIVSGHMVVESKRQTIKFLIGANRSAAAWVLKEAALRVPDIIDIDKSATEDLPKPEDNKGYQQDIEDHQVTGAHCAASKKVINLKEDARLCPQCGQIFHRESVPEKCTFCDTGLKGRTLKA